MRVRIELRDEDERLIMFAQQQAPDDSADAADLIHKAGDWMISQLASGGVARLQAIMQEMERKG